MNLYELNDDLCNRSVRIEKIILLAAAMIDESMSDDLKQILDEEDYTLLENIFGLPAGKAHVDSWDAEDIRGWLIEKRKFGFLINLATPVRTYFTENSWGDSCLWPPHFLDPCQPARCRNTLSAIYSGGWYRTPDIDGARGADRYQGASCCNGGGAACSRGR